MAVSTDLAVPWPLYKWSLVTPKHTERSALCLKDKMIQQYHATCHYQVEFLVCRALTFLKKSFDGTVPPMELAPEDEELVATVTKELRAFNEGLDKMK